MLCIAEKEAVVLNGVFNELRREMVKCGAYELKRHEIDNVTKELFTTNKLGNTVVNRKYVGKCHSFILKGCNMPVREDIKLIIAEVAEDHPFVTIDMLIPVLGIVSIYSVE
mgnify:CR=1 FL=1